MFVPITPPQASPRARELAREITEAVRKYRADNPNLSRMDLQQALRVAQNDLKGDLGGSVTVTTILVALGLALALLGGILFFFLQQR